MLVTTTATTATTNNPTMSSTKSAWNRGPPRSMSTSSPVTPIATDSPITSSTGTNANDIPAANHTSLNDTEPVTPVSPADPPPRPHRNPARKPSIVEVLPNCTYQNFHKIFPLFTAAKSNLHNCLFSIHRPRCHYQWPLWHQ